MSDGFFLFYILMALTSAVLLVLLTVRGYGLTTGGRVLSAIIGVACLLQALYLIFIFGGGEYTIGVWPFVGPVYAVVRIVRHRRAVRDRDLAIASRLWGPGGAPTFSSAPGPQGFGPAVPQQGFGPQSFGPQSLAPQSFAAQGFGSQSTSGQFYAPQAGPPVSPPQAHAGSPAVRPGFDPAATAWPPVAQQSHVAPTFNPHPHPESSGLFRQPAPEPSSFLRPVAPESAPFVPAARPESGAHASEAWPSGAVAWSEPAPSGSAAWPGAAPLTPVVPAPSFSPGGAPAGSTGLGAAVPVPPGHPPAGYQAFPHDQR